MLGGTRFFGVHAVNALLERGHAVTIATRGKAKDSFEKRVQRIILDRTDAESIRYALVGKYYDAVVDNICYCSNDIKALLDVLECGRYVYTSTTAVYDPKHIDTMEADFDPINRELVWCDRRDFSYAQVKRHAEAALWQVYGDRNFAAVRYPFVIGKDDYTKRLYFYVEHALRQKPMYVDNLECRMGFVRSDEAGGLLAHMAENEFVGAINGASRGTASIGDILRYVEKKTGKRAVLAEDGDPAPYNGEPDYSINTQKAQQLGYTFSQLDHWLYDLLDSYIEEITKEDEHA